MTEAAPPIRAEYPMPRFLGLSITRIMVIMNMARDSANFSPNNDSPCRRIFTGFINIPSAARVTELPECNLFLHIGVKLHIVMGTDI